MAERAKASGPPATTVTAFPSAQGKVSRMARRKMIPELVLAKQTLSQRLAALRAELFGERGGPEMARKLGIPVRTWYNYESGVTVPGEVVLKVVELTSVEASWLLHGQGRRFRTKCDEVDGGDSPKRAAIDLLRKALKLLEDDFSNGSELLPARSADAPPPRPTPALNGFARSHDDDDDEVASEPHEPFHHNHRAALPAHGGTQNGSLPPCVQNVGTAMSPIVADGGYVFHAHDAVVPNDLDGRLVVAWVDDEPLVRWFQFCGRFGILRAENPDTEPPRRLIDLEGLTEPRGIRRVLWINTPHGTPHRF